MLQTLVSHNDDIRSLVEKGYSIAFDSTNHLVIRDIPYLDIEGKLKIGAFVTNPWDPAHTILTGHRVLLAILGAILAAWGAYTAYLLVRNPDDLARVENHPSWTHMYLMMMAAQIGFAVAYLVPHHT